MFNKIKPNQANQQSNQNQAGITRQTQNLTSIKINHRKKKTQNHVLQQSTLTKRKTKIKQSSKRK